MALVGGSGAEGSQPSKQLSDEVTRFGATTSEKLTQKAGGKVERVHWTFQRAKE